MVMHSHYHVNPSLGTRGECEETHSHFDPHPFITVRNSFQRLSATKRKEPPV